MPKPAVERERIAWADFRAISTDIRGEAISLSQDWDVRFCGHVASDPGVFEADFDRAEQIAQDRFLTSQQKRHASQAQTLAEFKRPLNSQQRREIDALIRASAWNQRKGAYLEYLSLLVTLGQYRPASMIAGSIYLSTSLHALAVVRKQSG